MKDIEEILAKHNTSISAHDAAYDLLVKNRGKELPSDILELKKALEHHGNLLYAQEIWDSVNGDLEKLDKSVRKYVETIIAIKKADTWSEAYTDPQHPEDSPSIFRKKLEELGFASLETEPIKFPRG